MPRKAKQPASIDAKFVLQRAKDLDPLAVAVVVIGRDGRAINMWHTGESMLTLAGAAQNLTYEVSWSITQDCRTKTFPKPKKPKLRKKPGRKPKRRLPAKRK